MSLQAQTLEQKLVGYIKFEFLEDPERMNFILGTPNYVLSDLERIPVLENENMCSFWSTSIDRT